MVVVEDKVDASIVVPLTVDSVAGFVVPLPCGVDVVNKVVDFSVLDNSVVAFNVLVGECCVGPELLIVLVCELFFPVVVETVVIVGVE